MIKVDKENAIECITIDDDNFVVLLDYFDPIFCGNKELASNNIFLIDKENNIKWNVNSKFKISGGFVEIFLENNELKAISWDTGLYKINKDTGYATPEVLLK